MAVKLTSKANTAPISAAYPFGNIKDRVGSDPGTAVNTINHADFHQFFEKMMNYAAITHNGLPDNETNGFQLFEAFLKSARQDLPTLSTTIWTTNDVFTSAVFVSGASAGGSPLIGINAFRSGGMTTISGVVRINCDTATSAITTPNQMSVDLDLVTTLRPDISAVSGSIRSSGVIDPTSSSGFNGSSLILYSVPDSKLRVIISPIGTIIAGTFLTSWFSISYKSTF